MVENIIQWREALLQLEDHHFFELMRMYLGEVKTPFNKQKLLESLSSFFRNPEHKKIIMSLLDDNDIIILSAIVCIPHVTQEKLSVFFVGTFSFFILNEKILNLEERLIVYRYKELTSSTPHTVFGINPLLAQEIKNIAQGENFTSSYPIPAIQTSDEKIVCTSSYITAIIGFFLHETDTVKTDGSFKKRTAVLLEKSGLYKTDKQKEQFSAVLSALCNSGMMQQTENRMIPIMQRINEFIKLTPLEMNAYLCVFASGVFSQKTVHIEAQIVLDILFAMEKACAYSEAALYRLIFLQREYTYNNASDGKKSSAGKGRFANLLQERTAEPIHQKSNGTLLIQNALLFGLICKKNDMYFRNALIDKTLVQKIETPSIHIDSTNRVTLIQEEGFFVPLEKTIPLAFFLELKNIDTVCQFELTRTSCMDSFNFNFTPEKILSFLEQGKEKTIPQHIVFSLTEWYNSFLSVSLYNGYVLQVAETKAVYVENNEKIKPHIRAILAPGIYILDFSSPEEAEGICNTSGLDFIHSLHIKDSKNTVPFSMSYAHLKITERQNDQSMQTSAYAEVSKNSIFAEKHFSKLYEALDNMQLPQESYDTLRMRIDRKIILKPEQLRPESVRSEKIEASGMDFLGKVRLVQHAIATESLIELSYDDGEVKKLITGNPLTMEKTVSDSFLRIALIPDGKIETISISKTNTIKRIRGSIFKERSYT